MKTERNYSGWKLGDELLPFHPSASHVGPDYRDGWNACFAALAAKQPATGQGSGKSFAQLYEKSAQGIADQAAIIAQELKDHPAPTSQPTVPANYVLRGYWFAREARFASLNEAETYFDDQERAELLEPLFSAPTPKEP